MRVIKDNRIVEDGWERLPAVEPDQALPEGDIIIPFRYWLAHRDALATRKGRLAVCLDGEDEVEEVAGHLEHFPLIALDFPVFKDGRCYTHARLLRGRCHYTGELRAVGDILQDQLFFMRRVGIDSFQLRADKDMEDALRGFNTFSVTYQTSSDGAPPICKVRSKS